MVHYEALVLHLDFVDEKEASPSSHSPRRGCTQWVLMYPHGIGVAGGTSQGWMSPRVGGETHAWAGRQAAVQGRAILISVSIGTTRLEVALGDQLSQSISWMVEST